MFSKLCSLDDVKLEPEIEPLVRALNGTKVLETCYSCEGHFLLEGRVFCHHNQKAQVHFHPIDLGNVAKLCNQILNDVIYSELDVGVHQCVVPGENYHEIHWSLEYRPRDYWIVVPQVSNLHIKVNPKWTEEKVRALLRKAFDSTIHICESFRV